MRTFLLQSFVLTAVLTASYGALPRSKKRAFLAECEKIHQTGLDIDEILDKWLIPTSDKGKCLMECFVYKKGLIDDKANINHATATPHFEESFPDDPESLKKAEKAFAKCDELELKELDHCTRAVEILKCFRKNAKEVITDTSHIQFLLQIGLKH